MTPRTDTHLELYCRTETPEPIDSRLATLRADLASLAGDRGWSFGVTRWPTKVELTDDRPTESVVEHVYDRFTTWAEDRDVSLDPAFDVRDCYSWTTGDPCQALVMPVACLAVSRGDDLVSIYPHESDGTTYTIEDAIDALERGEDLPVAEREPRRVELTP